MVHCCWGQAGQAESMVSLSILFLLVSLDKPASLLRDVRVRVMGWESHSLAQRHARAIPSWRGGSREHLCSTHPAFTGLLTCFRGFWKALAIGTLDYTVGALCWVQSLKEFPSLLKHWFSAQVSHWDLCCVSKRSWLEVLLFVGLVWFCFFLKEQRDCL